MESATLVDYENPSEWDKLQIRAAEAMYKEYFSDERIIAFTAPTGFGKTKLSKMAIQGICHNLDQKWIFYTHRKSLFSQTRKSFLEDGFHHGCRAAGYEDFENLSAIGQLAMIQSETSALRHGRREMHDAVLAIVDEAHSNKSGYAAQIARRHAENGGKVLLFTATPVGLEGLAEKLVTLVSVTEARQCGALLPAKIAFPSTVDIGDLKAEAESEYPQGKLGAKFMNYHVSGNVYENWLKHNPKRLPTLLYAPSVQASKWFVDRLIEHGVRAAHIDGDHIYYGEKDEDGQNLYIDSTRIEHRDRLAEQSKTGEIEIVCNRFVLREGVDMPWIYHGIIATKFNTVSSWIQVCGRILRNYKDYNHVLITDHGGNIYELGSPNQDREWELGTTNVSLKEAVRSKPRPKVCPKCDLALSEGYWKGNKFTCVCGHTFQKSVHRVIQSTGELEILDESTLDKPKKSSKHEIVKAWESIYFPSSKSKNKSANTFKQLRARFMRDNPDWNIGTAGGKTVAKNHKTGELVPLRRIPPPQSSYWSWKANQTPIHKLQE